MSKNLLKQDIKLMLNQLVESLDDDKKVKYDGVVAQIYNEIENVPIIDLYVTREYLKDSINTILTASSKKKLEIKKENKSSTVTASTFRVVTDSEGEFSVIMTDEAGEEKIILRTKDQTVADAFKQKQAAAGEEVVPALGAPTDIEEDIGGIPEEDLPNTEVEKPNEGEEFTEEPELETSEEELPSEEFEEGPVDEVGDLNLEAIESATNRAEDLIGAIDNAIDIIPNLDAIVQLVEFKITLQDKKDSVLNADPSNANIQTMIQSLENILEEVESKAIDIINKNSPNDKAVDELVSAGEVHDEVKDIEEKADEQLTEEEEVLSNTSVESDKAAVTGDVDVNAEEDILEETDDEEVLEPVNELDLTDSADENIEEENVEEDIDVDDNLSSESLEKIEDLLSEIMNIVDKNVSDESVQEEVEEIVEEVKEEVSDVIDFDALLDEDFDTDVDEEVPEENLDLEPVEEELTNEEDLDLEPVEDSTEEIIEENVHENLDEKGFVVGEEEVEIENSEVLPEEDKEAIVAEDVMGVEEFLDWHDNKNTPKDTLDKVYEIFDKNGFDGSDRNINVDEIYSRLSNEDQMKVTELIKNAPVTEAVVSSKKVDKKTLKKKSLKISDDKKFIIADKTIDTTEALEKLKLIYNNPEKKSWDEYTDEDLKTVRNIVKIIGRKHSIGGYGKRITSGQFLDILEKTILQKQKKSGNLPEFTGKVSTVKLLAEIIAEYTNGKYVSKWGRVWTTGFGQRTKDPEDHIKYQTEEDFELAWNWIKSKGKEIHYKESPRSELRTGVKIGKFLLQREVTVHRPFSDDSEIEYLISVRTANIINNAGRVKQDITDEQAAVLRDIANTKTDSQMKKIKKILNLLKNEKNIKNTINNSEKINLDDKNVLNNIIDKNETIVSSKKVDKKSEKNEKKKIIEADETLPDGTKVSVSWIKKQLKDADIDFTNVKKTASNEFEIISKFKDNKVGKKWEKYEASVYDTLKAAGWKNKDAIFIV